ncbi:Ribonuclease 3 2 [Planktothrix tepida]|uniref:Ribonuclease 3 n=1 Tax=Planktothrix tepida PCC 9214 TaxID=671072 RepID=A0A1J1LL87_9CYAN|nr:ribonuclease III [Planktothrix tepida]CAD5943327.1 Ribonuclease 3 2 [Planktothrix tepida]CUR32966.1 Ribonuclease 3 2 [Planktothrix tepida PCC 9214]
MTLGYPNRKRQLQKLIQRLGLSNQAPIPWDLLDLALTHPTLSAEANYEQLEFVGDSVVRLVASELLFEVYPHCPVGEFAAIRSILVSDRTLAEIADYYGMSQFLLVAGSAMRDKAGEESRLADCFEAVLATLYLGTHDLTLIRPWLDPHFRQRAAEIIRDPARHNYKAALQEWTQSHHKILPEYKVQQNRQIHNDEERFTAEVWLKGRKLGEGTGRSIKSAEQAAAQVAFLSLVDTQNLTTLQH